MGTLQLMPVALFLTVFAVLMAASVLLSRTSEKAGIPVVQTSRAASGRIAPRRRLVESGIIAGEDFSPQKARILLMLMLSLSADRQAIAEAFRTY